MATLFSKIIDGEIPGHLVWQDEICAAFMDIEPLTPGHLMVVPRAEVDHWIDLDAQTMAHLMQVATRLGEAQMQAFQAVRIGVIIQGYDVPHTHIHVFPSTSAADFDIARRQSRSQEELAQDAQRIRDVLAG